MTNSELIALLREARAEWLRIHALYADGVVVDKHLLSRIDAALAAHNGELQDIDRLEARGLK